jgi:trehalose 6-phosphate phosphatase
MTTRGSSIRDLPNALHREGLARRIGDARPAVFLDYDGTLTPIVDRPQDAVISERMREAVLAWPPAAPSASSAGATGPWCRS